MTAPYDPHGAALLDCHRGDAGAMLACEQDGERDDVPAAFWLRDNIDLLEAMAIERCAGRILDVGAGAGVHALALQGRGFDVTAIDIAAACVTIMHERGVRKAQVADFYVFDGGPYDTILHLCNGLDKVGRLGEVPRFLQRMRALLAPGGQVLADSFDVRVGASAEQLLRLQRKTDSGRYFGEMDLCFEYKGQRGEPFSVLHIDYETLAHHAARSGWQCEKVAVDGGHYLARLTMTGEGT